MSRNCSRARRSGQSFFWEWSSYFAGVVQAPITAFVIVTEMSDNHAMVVPLMAAALIAYASSRLVCREGIYHALAKGFLRMGSDGVVAR